MGFEVVGMTNEERAGLLTPEQVAARLGVSQRTFR
jgi:hypothetical protein